MASPSDTITPHLSVLDCSPAVRDLLLRLHELSLSQALPESLLELQKANAAGFDAMVEDKLVALDPDKCAFIHDLILAKDARCVVEAGTSWGVSTIWWALAVGENVRRRPGGGGPARVVATEKEASKARKAREHWRTCGAQVESLIDLREGDLLDTLRVDLEEIDVLILDIWTPLVRPILDLVRSKLKPGAVILADNTIAAKEGYADLMTVLRDPEGDFRTTTLPFDGGLEMSVYWPRAAST